MAIAHLQRGLVNWLDRIESWLDRERDPEHAFTMTRNTAADAAQLHAFLIAQVESSRPAHSEGAVP